MLYYYALVEGENFIINLEGEKTDIGFFTTFYFKGNYEYKEEVINSIMYQLKNHISNNESGINFSRFSYFYIKELKVLDNFTDIDLEKGGFTFFKLTKVQVYYNYFYFYLANILIKCKLFDSLRKPILL